MCLLANKNWHWQAVSCCCCDVLLLLSTNTERRLLLSVSLMPGSAVQSPSSTSCRFSCFLSQYSPLPLSTWPALKQMVQRSLGRNELQGRCLWISGLRGKKRKTARGTLYYGMRGGRKGTEGRWMLPRHATSVCSVSLSVGSQVHQQRESVFLHQNRPIICF